MQSPQISTLQAGLPLQAGSAQSMSPLPSLSMPSSQISGPQPSILVCWHAPSWQVSVVQLSLSLQSASVLQGVQPGISVIWQLPSWPQTFVVQALLSSQSAFVLQRTQPGTSAWPQTLPTQS